MFDPYSLKSIPHYYPDISCTMFMHLVVRCVIIVCELQCLSLIAGRAPKVRFSWGLSCLCRL